MKEEMWEDREGETKTNRTNRSAKGKREKKETEIQLRTVGPEKRKEKRHQRIRYEALRRTGRCQCVGYRKLKGEKMKMRGEDKT